VPVRLVQESLREIKRLHGLHEERRLARRRVHVEVLAANVLWHQDATHLGRVDGRPSQAEILRDAARSDVLAASAGGVVRGRDAAALLESAIAAEALAGNAPPLVVATDNGPAYRSRAFAACVARHRIVHLRNLPRTPQLNARAERTIRDVKQASGLGRGVLLDSFEEARHRVALACERLAVLARIRAGAEHLTVQYTQDRRDRFYEAVCRRIATSVQCARNARDRRMAEREAVFAELEERGLIHRTRGGAALGGRQAERVS
jgi:transposase InsO family protein